MRASERQAPNGAKTYCVNFHVGVLCSASTMFEIELKPVQRRRRMKYGLQPRDASPRREQARLKTRGGYRGGGVQWISVVSIGFSRSFKSSCSWRHERFESTAGIEQSKESICESDKNVKEVQAVGCWRPHEVHCELRWAVSTLPARECPARPALDDHPGIARRLFGEYLKLSLL